VSRPRFKAKLDQVELEIAQADPGNPMRIAGLKAMRSELVRRLEQARHPGIAAHCSFLERELRRHQDGKPHRQWVEDYPVMWPCCSAPDTRITVYFDGNGDLSREDQVIIRLLIEHHHRAVHA
jgi:hypothetical protein